MRPVMGAITSGVAQIDLGGFDIGAIGFAMPSSEPTSATWVSSVCCEIAFCPISDW